MQQYAISTYNRPVTSTKVLSLYRDLSAERVLCVPSTLKSRTFLVSVSDCQIKREHQITMYQTAMLRKYGDNDQHRVNSSEQVCDSISMFSSCCHAILIRRPRKDVRSRVKEVERTNPNNLPGFS